MASARTARAEAITFIETATATGSLGGQSFANALVTLTATGDTANVLTDGFQSAEMSVPLDLTIAGVGSTEFTDPIIVVFNGHTGPNEAYGFGDTYPNIVEGYAILSTFVPYTGTFMIFSRRSGRSMVSRCITLASCSTQRREASRLRQRRMRRFKR
jgi:hypothetical protein